MELNLNLEIENPILLGIINQSIENLVEIIHEEESAFLKALEKGITNEGAFSLSQITKYDSDKKTIKTTLTSNIKVKGECSNAYIDPDQMTFADVD